MTSAGKPTVHSLHLKLLLPKVVNFAVSRPRKSCTVQMGSQAREGVQACRQSEDSSIQII